MVKNEKIQSKLCAELRKCREEILSSCFLQKSFQNASKSGSKLVPKCFNLRSLRNVWGCNFASFMHEPPKRPKSTLKGAQKLPKSILKAPPKHPRSIRKALQKQPKRTLKGHHSKDTTELPENVYISYKISA